MYIDILQRSTVGIKPKRGPGSEVTVNAYISPGIDGDFAFAELKLVVSHTSRISRIEDGKFQRY